MTEGSNQACIHCFAGLALLFLLAEVYTIHLLLNAIMESFQLEHKCANEKWEISLHEMYGIYAESYPTSSNTEYN